MYETSLHNAKLNGHEPGYIFESGNCFCKKCHAPLIYRDDYYIETSGWYLTYKLKSKINIDWTTSVCNG